MASPRKNDWLEVIKNGESIAEARRLAFASMDSRVRQLIQEPEKFRYDDIDRVVKANIAELLPAWRKVAASADQPFVRRLVAARFLCDRRDDGGLGFLAETVRNGKKQARRDALVELFSVVCRDASWMRLRAQELPGELLKLLDRANDDLIPMTAHMCKDLEVAGGAKQAMVLWEEPISPWARHALLTDLIPRESKSGKVLKPIEALFSRKRLSKFDRSEGLHCAVAFLDAPDPGVVRRSLALIQKYFPWKDRELLDDDSGAGSEWYPIIEEAGKRGGRVAVPLLEKFLRSKLNAQYRGFALKALAVALGPEVLPYVDESMDELRLASAIATALGQSFKGTGDAGVIDRLQKLASRTEDEFARYQITAALKAVGGTRARKAARKQIARSPPSSRLVLKAVAEKTTLSQACSRLAEIGLIRLLSPGEIQEIQSTDEREPDDPAWSLLVLDYTHIRTCFDTESSGVPPPHDQLIREFAENSRGIFSPEAVLQNEGKGRRKQVLVQFVFGDRLYRFEVRDFSDYYDLERAVAAMNRGLADAGFQERYLSRDTGDQIADFIFGEPRLISQAAQEFKWTLDERFNRLTTVKS